MDNILTSIYEMNTPTLKSAALFAAFKVFPFSTRRRFRIDGVDTECDTDDTNVDAVAVAVFTVDTNVDVDYAVVVAPAPSSHGLICSMILMFPK